MSPKSTENVFEFILTKGPAPTLKSTHYGFNESVRELTLEAGSIPQQIRLNYLPGEPYTNGTLEITAEGITFGVDNYYHDGRTVWKQFTQDMIYDNGHKVIIDGLLGSYSLAFTFYNQVISQEGTYNITFIADADGTNRDR
ncbi:hypothetical protein [Paenibacillus sp. FSL R7-0652]|jgi:hypothetical protein|uniref:BppU N-terminal domain-containing protein n=1 Tax=Paenibacillus sp. AN1007 TaxID=3151385 RepID=A0AAU8NKZ6_9BACL